MTTSSELFAQAKVLLDQANEVLRREKLEAIHEIKEKISKYNISAKDLGFSQTAPRFAKGRDSGMFRGPAGQSWTGRGRRPQWLKDAVAEGADPESFRAD